MRRLGGLVVLVGAALLAGCGGDGKVKQADVERLGVESLEAQGHDDVEMDCPGGIEGEEGATLVCTATFDGDDDAHDVEVTVGELDGDTASLGYELTEPLEDGTSPATGDEGAS